MPTDQAESERQRIARLRFHKFKSLSRDTCPFQVCDRDSKPQCLARFRDEENAELFLDLIRQRYIDEG